MQTQPSPPPDPTLNPNRGPGCWGYGLLLLAGAVLLGEAVFSQGLLWLIDLLFQLEGGTLPGWASLLATWAQFIVTVVPLALLAAFTQAPRLRAIYWAWATASVIAAVVALARLFPPPVSALAMLVHMGLALGCALALGLVVIWRRRPGPRARSAYLLPALALAPLVALPFIVWGALGSLLDTALNLALGLSLGLIVALLLDGLVLRAFAAAPAGRAADVGLAALAAVVLLVILLNGFGLAGAQGLLYIVLPPVGLAAAALGVMARRARAPRSAAPALTVLVGLVAAAPLAFIDPDELVAALGSHDILEWAQRAAWLIFGLGLLIGLAVLLWAALAPDPAAAEATPRRPSAAGTALGLGGLGAAWLVALLGYALAGQPGLYGDSFFVILADQADVSAAAHLPDRVARLTNVYTTLVTEADTSQAALRQLLDRLGVHYTPYYLVNAIEVDAGPLVRLYLSTRPEVGRLLDSPHLRPLPEPAPEDVGNAFKPSRPDWNITAIGADRVWDELNVTGQGIVIGQSDSGVQGDHPALADGYRGRASGDAYNWYDPWNHTLSPTDAGSHGTHTLGTALGRGGIGVAPGAEWIGCVNLARNLANPALYLDCMQFMLAPFPPGGDPLHAGDPSRAAHVLNNSWGCPLVEGCDALALQPAVAALRAAGIFVVASAGNSGPQCGSVADTIAIYDEVFTVGAVDENGNLIGFSSRGPVTADGSNRLKPDIVAPGGADFRYPGSGREVLSSTPGNTYARYSGTSMAGPHVVGTVALMWSANPALIGDIDRTEQLLRDTAAPYVGTVQDQPCEAGRLPTDGVGYGLLDAYAAVQAALALR